jgi:hypothetical protein
VNESNQLQATELLLKINTNYLPENVENVEKIDYNRVKTAIISAILVLIFWIKPRTTIGVGKHKDRIKIYGCSIKLILITIPAIFIVPPIIEFIKDLF